MSDKLDYKLFAIGMFIICIGFGLYFVGLEILGSVITFIGAVITGYPIGSKLGDWISSRGRK